MSDGKPVIERLPDGPYTISVIELAGQTFGQGVSAAGYTLCRCGASRNKPFCDGSHWSVDFGDDAE